MSAIDLMLLGVLIQKPMNAYEIKKEMEYRDINQWIKISSPSIYKNLLKLCRLGYIDGKTMREGSMPEKTVYYINADGRKYFMKLMGHYSDDPGRIYVDFCAFIANLPYVDPQTGLQLLEKLRKNLGERQKKLEAETGRVAELSFYGASIVGLYSQIYEVLDKWTENFSRQYRERGGRD